MVNAHKDNSKEKFWADTPIQFAMANRPAVSATNPDRSFGTPLRPLMIGSSSNVDFNGAILAYGLFYAATATATENHIVVGTGSATVVGSIVTRSDFIKGAGTLNLIYRADLFSPALDFGTMVRVPGSWRDTLNDL